MLTLAYLSNVARPLSKEELFELAAFASENNRKRNICGLLLYSGQKFLQVLQGNEIAVRELFGKIVKDTRHRNVTVIIESQSMAREFGDWSMAFKDLTLDERVLHPELSNFFDGTEIKKPEQMMPAQAMLELFRTTYLA